MSNHGFIQIIWESYESFDKEIYRALDLSLTHYHGKDFERMFLRSGYYQTINGVWTSVNNLEFIGLLIDIYDLFFNENYLDIKIKIESKDHVRVIGIFTEYSDFRSWNLEDVKNFLNNELTMHGEICYYDIELLEKWNIVKSRNGEAK